MTGTCMMKYIINAKSSFLELNVFTEDMATELLRIECYLSRVPVTGLKACSMQL